LMLMALDGQLGIYHNSLSFLMRTTFQATMQDCGMPTLQHGKDWHVSKDCVSFMLTEKNLISKSILQCDRVTQNSLGEPNSITMLPVK
jgi:hypothetical protein